MKLAGLMYFTVQGENENFVCDLKYIYYIYIYTADKTMM